MAAEQIDKFADPEVPKEELRTRPDQGPKEFREIRGDQRECKEIVGAMNGDWNCRLRRSVTPSRSETLYTLSDARAYVLALSPGLRHQDDWQRTAELLMVAAETGKPMDIQQATFQLERALLFHNLLATGASPEVD
jgi:hypothetical protein